MALLEVDAFGVGYGEAPALAALTFNINKGRAFGVAGVAGAGKTTLALAIAGLLPPGAAASGAIRFDGNPLPAHETALARLRGQRIGLVLGDGRMALDPQRRLGEQVRNLEVLTECALEPACFPQELSPVQLRQGLVAMALAQQPDILVADEPAHGLDPIGARQVLDLLARLQRSRGFALLLMSRDYRAVSLCCTEAMVLRAGRAVELGPPASIFGHPRHDYTRALVGAARLRPRTLTRTPIGTDMLTLRDVGFAMPDGGTARINLAIRQGEALALIGGPRAGKTRLARIVAGLERAGSGLLVLDHDSHHGDDIPAGRRREIAMIFARPERSFSPRLAIGTSLSEPLRLEPHRTMDEQADRLIDTVRAVGLAPDLLRRLPAELEPTQLHRLALARALMARPRLLVIDDAAGGLDPDSRNAVVDLIDRLRADYSLTLLLTTRDLDIARALADRALVMHNGTVVEEGRPGELIDGPQHPFTQALVEARLPDQTPPDVPAA